MTQVEGTRPTRSMSMIRHVVAPADIIRNGGELQLNIEGATELQIRSGFPCYIEVDGNPLTTPTDGAPWFKFRPNPTRRVRIMSVYLHPPNGGETESDAYSQHAHLIVEGARGDELKPMMPDPKHLPHTRWYSGDQSHIAGQTLKEWSANVSDLFALGQERNPGTNLGDGRLPREIWLTAVVAKCTENGTEAQRGNVHRLTIAKSDSPVGDEETLLDLVPNVSMIEDTEDQWRAGPLLFPLPYVYLPVHSWAAAFAAETPQVQFSLHTDSSGSTRQCHVTLCGAYRM